MALIHQLLYGNEKFVLIPMNKYTNQLLSQLQKSYFNPQKKIDIEENCDQLNFDLDIAIPIGLIINEIVSNAFKYAFEGRQNGKINFSLIGKSKNEYQLFIADDGIGFPENITERKEKSLGLELIEMLCEQINGKLNILSDEGVKFTIDFKK
jgi:two-component sensor histidine kinase